MSRAGDACQRCQALINGDGLKALQIISGNPELKEFAVNELGPGIGIVFDLVYGLTSEIPAEIFTLDATDDYQAAAMTITAGTGDLPPLPAYATVPLIGYVVRPLADAVIALNGLVLTHGGLFTDFNAQVPGNGKVILSPEELGKVLGFINGLLQTARTRLDGYGSLLDAMSVETWNGGTGFATDIGTIKPGWLSPDLNRTFSDYWNARWEQVLNSFNLTGPTAWQTVNQHQAAGNKPKGDTKGMEWPKYLRSKYNDAKATIQPLGQSYFNWTGAGAPVGGQVDVFAYQYVPGKPPGEQPVSKQTQQAQAQQGGAGAAGMGPPPAGGATGAGSGSTSTSSATSDVATTAAVVGGVTAGGVVLGLLAWLLRRAL